MRTRDAVWIWGAGELKNKPSSRSTFTTYLYAFDGKRETREYGAFEESSYEFIWISCDGCLYTLNEIDVR